MDARTGLLMWALEAETLAAVLAAVWFSARHQRCALFGALGFALHGLGLAGVGLRGQILDFLSIHIANTISLLGIGLWVAAARAMDRRAPSVLMFAPALIWVLGMMVPAVRETLWARIALAHLGSAAGYGLIAHAFLNPEGGQRVQRRILAGLQVLLAANSLLCTTLALIFRPISFQAVTGPFLGGLIQTTIICSLFLSARLLLTRREGELRSLAETDPLTGLLNRRGFAVAFAELAGGRAANDGLVTAMIHFDIDHFKRINDAHGHEVGDRVLVRCAEMTTVLLGDRGVVGRLGGEEFACALRVADMDEAAVLAERLLARFRQDRVRVEEAELSFTVSAGISLARQDDMTPDGALSRADRALYAAKQAGRDRIALDRAPAEVLASDGSGAVVVLRPRAA